MSELKGPTHSGSAVLVARLRGRKAAARTWADLKQALPLGAATGRLRSRLSIDGQDRALLDRQSALMGVSAPAILVAAARATIARYLQSDETFHIALADAAGAGGFAAIPVAAPGRQVVAELLADSEGRLQTGKGDAAGEPRIVLRIRADVCTSAGDTIENGEQLSIAFRVAPAAAEICAAGAGDLFSQRTLDDFVEQIGWMARQLGIKDAKAPLDALALLPLAQRERLLEWGSCPVGPAEALPPVHVEFERFAHQHPERAALVFEGRQLSYGELNAEANRLAHCLIAMGVRPDDRVALYAERGFEIVVGLLAILKAGGGYVPLDPVYPAERIAYMLADSAPKVVLTQQRLADRLPGQVTRLVIDDAAAFADEPSNDPDPAVLGLDAEHLAYVIYTSGSTGQPKGILLPGRVLSNLIAWHNRVWPGRPGFAVAQFASINFDMSLQEILWTLTSGMTLKIPTDRCRHDINAFVPWMSRNKINALFATTTAIDAICAIAKRDDIDLSDLQVLFQAGEALRLSPALSEFCNKHGCRLFNYYGPSETHVATAYELLTDAGDGAVLPPIGRPIANTNIYILDGRGEPVPVGVLGEIYIGGMGVARGYLNRPELTTERFLADHFSAVPGARMYRTGDLGRWLADGNIEYLGRNDFQVKLRGFRIELGEIEARLAACPGVGEAVVIAREDVPGDKRLVAYVRASAGAKPTVSDLRGRLAATLPDHMVPSAFVVLDAFPLTVNGKLDRKALPAPDLEALAARAYEPPAGPVEEMLAAIWRELLHVERVGRRDNFFELGGHSLLATGLAGRVGDALAVDLALNEIFDAPTLHGLAGRVEELRRDEQGVSLPALVAQPRDGGCPASYAQERLWFVDQLEPLNPVYNMAAAWRLDGRLDAAALAKSLATLVERHESLRTRFASVDGACRQIINTAEGFGLRMVDISELEASSRTAEARRLADEEAARPFDLAAGPLFRATLVRLSEEEQVLLLTMHHIVSDAWSLGILTSEFVALYRAFATGSPSPLPPLPVQYADYALWQRRWLTGELLERQVAYWQERLAGAPAALELPTDRPRPVQQSYRGAVLPVALPEALLTSLSRLASHEGATLYMVLLTAFQLLLSRWSGQDDVVVGSPIAGRTARASEGLVGFFVNTLAQRLDLSGQPSFRELLARNREHVLGAYVHQEVPFERLVQELKINRDPSRQPLFQVMFALQNVPDAVLGLPGLRVTPFAIEYGTSKFDLTLALTETGTGLRGVLEYATDLFNRPTMERLFGHYRTLLEGIVADPACMIGRLPLLSEAQRAQVVGEWSGADQDYPRERCIHELFEERAELHPDAPAVSFRGEAWSYGELDRRADLVAGALRCLGVGPEVPVGLFTERSLEMVAGLLGILKAGGAYVPLDPSYPAERLEWMLRDTCAPVVLVQERLLGDLPAGSWRAAELESLCRDSGVIAAPARSAGTSPDNLAYVLYTSGSTGKPKGVAVPHRAVARLVRGRDDLRIGAGEVWLQLAPLAFDASTLEIWGALANGGRLEVFAPEKPTVEELGRRVESAGVTSLWLTAGLFHQVVESDLQPWRGLHKLLAGGDVLSPSHVRRALEELPGCRVINGYGPTENTTFTCCHALTSPSQVEGPVPIGRPIANTRVYLVDRHSQPVPPGTPGELLTGGDGLARGYHGRPDLTAEFFVPDPFAEQPGERLYRTGDLARWRPSGEIEFLGRFDQQVKIRGFRVEPGEIEVALAHHAGVREALVLAVEDEPGDKRLVAYVVASGDRRPEAEELRAFLLERLPEHMVPSVFVSLPELPLTANGKVDRKALTALRPKRIVATPGAEPRTPAEELLAAIFAEVLGLERVGIEDDFFNLGGHSLMATRLVSRLREVFDRELPLRFIFESPTVAKLAERIASLGEGQSAPPIQPVPRNPGLLLSFAQQRLWLVDQLEPGNPAYNIPLALRLTGTLSPGLLERIFAEIVRRHEVLRTTFEVREGAPAQVIAPPGGAIPLPLIDLSADPGREAKAQALALEEARRPFNLQRGPLLRLFLIRLAEREHILLVNLHHIVSDGWSLGVLLLEVGTLHEAFSQGLPSPLPDLPVQYADFAVWQRNWLQGEVLEAQLAHWKRQLAGAPAVLELPLDRPRPVVQSFRGASLPVVLPAALSDAVSHLCRQQGVTPFMALLAAWAVLLGRHAGQDEVLLGSPIAGRTRREIEGLIGFFVNTLVLRSDLSGNPNFGKLLERVRRTALDAFAHQDLPFERIVEEVAVERNLAVSPLFQVMFALQNAPLGELTLPGLEFSPVDVETGLAKFDLSLILQEGSAGFAGTLEHNADLFDGSTAERLGARFAALLEGAVADPGQPLADLPLLLPAERWQLQEWNETGAAPAPTHCLHELFAAQAARTPEAVALVHRAGRLTYAELAAHAGGLAHRLRALGAGPETRVAVCLERSPDLIASLIGVLAAGAAYVPVDPAYPVERRALMLQDSGAAVLVTRGALAADLPATGACLLDLDAGEIPAGSLPQDTGVGPDHLAYLIYTSGSTGRPKAVAIEHRSAVALAGWAREEFSDEELGGVLAATSVCFDLSVFEIFVPLAFGGTVLLAENALELPALPAAAEVRLLNTVPSAAAELVRSGGLPAAVRTVCLAGEPLPAALVARLYATGTVQRLLNLYGPSEDTTYSTGALIPPASDRAPAIGRPIRGTRAYVIDRHGTPVPPGVAGELWLAGAGLARGYLGRPELTAERFTPDPFGGPGDRVYQTGDLVRFRLDGELDFLGRIDHQVKVRGFRVELGEIETVLGSHPGVRECVVLVRENTLVAYVVGSREISDLRSFLGRRLPDYMVPSVFVALEALPLSPNGKVDRKALPAPQLGGAAEGGHGAPSDPVEELLAGIWSEVLGIERVGVHENFFALGGHSLLATQVASRIRGLLGVELPLRQLFEAPTIADLARAVSEAGSAVRVPPILPVPRNRALPLSFAQQRLWLIDQIDPGNPAYNIPLALRLQGEIERGLLERVFSEIVRRHEVLRTVFASREGRPAQMIAGPEPLELPLLDLSHLPENQREAQARALALSEARHPFDLQHGPLLRLVLVRLAEMDHLLLVTLHHIVSDGWSQGVLLREVVALHEAFLQGLPSPLAELPVQYADFAVWQRSWLQGEILDAQLNFWKQRLAGAPAVLELPLDRPRPAVQTFRGATRPFHLELGLSNAVRDLCRREGATPFMALLAALTVLLGRHSRQEDVLVGAPIAGRNRREIEGLIGFFVNTLVLRSDLSGSPSFGELLTRVRRAALDAFTHQDLPFERIVEEVVVERNLAVSPLFQVLFTLQNAPIGNFNLPGLVFSPFSVDTGVAKFDLSLTLQENPAGFVGTLEHNADLFDGSTVERLLARFASLLEAAARDSSLSVSDLPILLPGERQQALVEWNDTASPFVPVCLHELVEAQVDRSPDAVALVSGGESLTYRELDLQANHMAHHLLSLGVGPDILVGLCAERSPEMVVGMLGILKAGGAYVPIDPDYPQERLAFLLEDSGTQVLLTQRHLADRLPSGEVRVVLLDGEEGVENTSGERPRARAVPENLAYVIYTSGSTGRPKGVLVPHKGVVNRLLWAQNAYPVTAADRILHKASFSFDFSVWECFAPLIVGAQLVLARPGEQRDAALLVRTIQEREITLVHFIPSMLQVFLMQEEVEACTSLRYIFSGGEVLSLDLQERCLSRVPAVLRNQYGPTEISIDTTDWVCRPEDSRRGFVPLGFPISNTALYVLDQRLSPVPPGVVGELCVGGAGVTRGYWGRPDLTAEKFVPDPFSEDEGARLYRTGDLALRLPDGNFKFLGRVDHQVKIRGFRVELGEIEATLASHPSVRECVLLVREDVPGSRLISAYAVLNPKPELRNPKSSLRSFLGERLPEYMVPSAIVILDALPLLPNGKLDRRALPAPQGSRAVDESYTAPSNPVEELLAGIWGEVLGTERLGIHESFFALGGHSLLATQVIARIRTVLGRELPLRQLFESPTIAGLARAVQNQGSTLQAPPLLPVPRDRDLPLSFAQQRLWLVDQIEPGSPAYNMPLALRLIGEIEPRRLERIFSEIVRRHEALRTSFPSPDNSPVQVIALAEPVEVPVLDLSSLPESEREIQARNLAFCEAQRPFDLRRGPLLRLLLVRLDETDHLLLLTLHHIVSDGWSMGVLLREIAALHEAFSQGRPSPLAELPVQYADFAVWQRSWLQGEVLDAQLDLWKRQLEGAPAVLEMPLDRPRPAVQSYRGERRPVVLSYPLSEAISHLCRQQGLTPFMTLLAAWTVLLGRHAGQDDVVVGTPIAGRNRQEIEGLIGFFLNTLVLRSDLSRNPSLAELLRRVRRTTLDAFSNQDLPFERLVEDLAPDRSLAHAPLFQVMFVLQNVPTRNLTIPGLTISPVDVDAGQAKFDLSLTLFESSEGFAGALTYATDIFDPSTMERLIAGFQTLLAAMAEADPAAPLHGLEVLPEAERRQLLVEWSAEETRISDVSLYWLFERQAERTPDAMAVIYEEERWTYRDLLRRSREIAGFLREQGVGLGDCVAILDRRSAERVARVLGVLASGAAFVAIDREQPRTRRAEILADVAPVWVFPPQPPLAEDGEEEGAGVTFLPEGDTPASPGSCSRRSESSCLGPAYVVYTSGSTGRPKGILAHHRGAATYLEWIVRNYGLSESDVALQLAPLTFDASLRDTFAPLFAGGRIVIVPEDVMRDPAALLERMEAHGVTCLPSLVPSLLRLLLEEALASGRKVPSLRLILASGEKVYGADAAAVRRAFGERVSLVNQYGASEATMCSTWYAVTADDEARADLPVGRPAASVQVFLLDRELRPVPLGAVGEICFGGPGLTFGYLGQPDRTAEAFVPNPFGTPGERLYRTGDRGRYRSDRILELLGRIDFQVKIRGQRVEPGEVEAVLRSHPAVRQAVVAARGENEPRLVAWLVAEGVEAGDLRAFLTERLPAPMIPADWAFLDALPLTPHGKVDRSRLPEPTRERTAVQEPRDRTELRLVRLWEEVLGIQPVGISDNFFALGGHSLSAVRLMAGIRRLFGQDLPLSELFRRPTIERLADTLRCGDRDLPWSPLVALTPGRVGEVPLFCIHGGDGHALTFVDLARTLSAAGEDRPVFALEARGLANDQTPLEHIEDLAELYLSAIREAWPLGPYRLLGYSMGGKIAFEMARRLEQEGETVELIFLDIPALPRLEAVADLEIPAEIRALQGFDPELADRYLAVWRANLKASHSWTPVPFGGKILLLVAEEGIYAGAPDSTLGWGAVAGGGVEVASTPGNHFSLLRPPHVQALVERLRSEVAAAYLGRNREEGSALVAL